MKDEIHITACIDKQTKTALEDYCKQIDLTSSQLIRRLIKNELQQQRQKEKEESK